MCVLAGALGGAALPLWAKLGLGVVGAVVQHNQGVKKANYKAEAAVTTAENANRALTNELNASSARLKEERLKKSKEIFENRRKIAEAGGAIRASEGTGLLFNILQMDAERQGLRNQVSLNQTLSSIEDQYARETKGSLARRDSRYNQAIDMRNTAMANAPSPFGTLLGIGTNALGGYLDVAGPYLSQSKPTTSAFQNRIATS